MNVRGWIETTKPAALGSIAAGVLTAFGYHAHLDFASMIPLFLLLVVAQSLTGDFRGSAFVCILSAGCLDLCFTRPLFSLRIDSPLNGLALVAFLLTALVITKLVTKAREEAKTAVRRKHRLDRL